MITNIQPVNLNKTYRMKMKPLSVAPAHTDILNYLTSFNYTLDDVTGVSLKNYSKRSGSRVTLLAKQPGRELSLTVQCSKALSCVPDKLLVCIAQNEDQLCNAATATLTSPFYQKRTNYRSEVELNPATHKEYMRSLKLLKAHADSRRTDAAMLEQQYCLR
ncbi:MULTISPECIES: hypothetical protein [Enterobacteriaceae]|nr:MULTISPECIES: hypothetical protein [Enterobacteriaceae]MCE9984162.1 hypothetical protein [Leclercia adecarboxylata]OOB84486.1 hypothetical protein BZY71_24545 [Leclercia adecarboxylata]